MNNEDKKDLTQVTDDQHNNPNNMSNKHSNKSKLANRTVLVISILFCLAIVSFITYILIDDYILSPKRNKEYKEYLEKSIKHIDDIKVINVDKFDFEGYSFTDFRSYQLSYGSGILNSEEMSKILIKADYSVNTETTIYNYTLKIVDSKLLIEEKNTGVSYHVDKVKNAKSIVRLKDKKTVLITTNDNYYYIGELNAYESEESAVDVKIKLSIFNNGLTRGGTGKYPLEAGIITYGSDIITLDGMALHFSNTDKGDSYLITDISEYSKIGKENTDYKISDDVSLHINDDLTFYLLNNKKKIEFNNTNIVTAFEKGEYIYLITNPYKTNKNKIYSLVVVYIIDKKSSKIVNEEYESIMIGEEFCNRWLEYGSELGYKKVGKKYNIIISRKLLFEDVNYNPTLEFILKH